MAQEMDIFLIDDSNNPIEALYIEKPKNFHEFISEIKKYFDNLPTHYVIFYTGDDNRDVIIHNENDYYKIHDIVFIKKIVPSNLGKSLFTRNYEKLPEPQKEKYSLKYTCTICSDLIKNENPLFCYVCQKIFHHECLESWAKQREENYHTLNCPNCRKELPLEEWKAKLDFEEIRKNDAEIMDLLVKSDNSENSNEYIKKSSEVFIIILNRIKEVFKIMNQEEDFDKIDNLISELSINYANPPLDDTSSLILEKLEIIDEFLKKPDNYVKLKKDDQQQNQKGNANEINLIYYVENDGEKNIFGKEFVDNNKDKIELIINGKESSLVAKTHLKQGENNIKIIIKNKLTNISYMFSECTSLKGIDELKFLDTKDVVNFEFLFYNCNLLTDVAPLSNWDTSKGTNFRGIFKSCKSLRDIDGLANWNMSNNTNFSEFFSFCISLKDINSLRNWNVINGKNFGFMFYGCASLSNLNPLEDWNVSNAEDFSGIFCSCSLISDLEPLKKWNLSSNKVFQSMFSNCKYLSDLTPIKNWDVSSGNNFSGMFFCCDMLKEITPLRNWKVSIGSNISNMFGNCPDLKDLSSLKKWNLSHDKFQLLQKL